MGAMQQTHSAVQHSMAEPVILHGRRPFGLSSPARAISLIDSQLLRVGTNPCRIKHPIFRSDQFRPGGWCCARQTSATSHS